MQHKLCFIIYSPIFVELNINLIMKTGTVKFFNNTKGFGFITEDGSGTEHFVHVSGLIDQINENDKVSYDLKEGKRGLNAVDVRKLP